MYKTSPTCQIPKLPEIYQFVFGSNYVGSFVEVGAYDGLTYSNTYGLAEMGWRGLYIEPVYAAYRECVHNHEKHPNIKVLNKCVGDGNPAEMFLGGESSTTNEEFSKLCSSIWGVKYKGKLGYVTDTLDDILEVEWKEYVGFKYTYPAIDLLVIDVEGANEIILKNFTVSMYKPRMVIIEAHEQSAHKALKRHAVFVNDYFEKSGYNKIYSDNCNNIYVRR
jgi:hypothetical protein